MMKLCGWIWVVHESSRMEEVTLSEESKSASLQLKTKGIKGRSLKLLTGSGKSQGHELINDIVRHQNGFHTTYVDSLSGKLQNVAGHLHEKEAFAVRKMN